MTPMLDELIRGVLSGDDPGPLLDFCEESEVDVPRLVREPVPCESCCNSNGRRTTETDGCSICNGAGRIHLPWTVLREYRRLHGWDVPPEFDGRMDGQDGPYTRRHTSDVDAVRQLIDRTEGTVECPNPHCFDGAVLTSADDDLAIDGRIVSVKEASRRCRTCNPNGDNHRGRVPNPDAPIILELYALMLRDSGGHREEYVHAREPMGDLVGQADIVPGLLVRPLLWPEETEAGRFLLKCPWDGTLIVEITRTAALHALALAAVTAKVECPDCRFTQIAYGHLAKCRTCGGSGAVPFLETCDG